jgi:AP-1 complex subunit mu
MFCFSPVSPQTSQGTVKYAPEQNAIRWIIKQFPGGKEFMLRAHFGLPSIEQGGHLILVC